MYKNIHSYLPHRYPFLLVDKIVFLKKYYYILAIKNITIAEIYFLGHFPSHSIFPGVLIIESLAQTCGLLINVSINNKSKGPNFFLTSLNKTRFKKIVFPGDKLYLEVKIENIKKFVWKFLCRAFVNGVVVCISEISCFKIYDLYR